MPDDLRQMNGSDGSRSVTPPGAGGDVEAFLRKAAETPPVRASGRGRLIFALDATMSRQATWDLAQGLTGRMFEATSASFDSKCR